MHDPTLVTLISLVVGGSVLLLTLINTNAAIVFLIFSMLLSPEINLGAVQPGRAVVIRFDDFLLGVVFLTWLAKLAINKQLGFLRSTPLNVPLGLFLISCIVSTSLGVMTGTIKNPLASMFYFLKYFEYFFLFFMVANVVRDRIQVRLFLQMMLATAVIVCLYGYGQMAVYGTGYRITAPFEGSAEPNTLAAYLVLIAGICGGLALYSPSPFRRLVLLGLILFMVPPLLYTYSRGGYVAFLAMYATLCVPSTRYRPLLIGILVIGLAASPILLPASVLERLAATFDPSGVPVVGGMRLSASPAFRVIVWKAMIERWKEQPLLGFGIAAVGLVDQQYMLVLGELGIVGFLLFLWVRVRLMAVSYGAFIKLDDPMLKGLSLGFIAGFVGLLVHSFAANIFIIVRVMEPFWFLAAMVTTLLQVAKQDPAVASALNRRLVTT